LLTWPSVFRWNVLASCQCSLPGLFPSPFLACGDLFGFGLLVFLGRAAVLVGREVRLAGAALVLSADFRHFFVSLISGVKKYAFSICRRKYFLSINYPLQEGFLCYATLGSRLPRGCRQSYLILLFEVVFVVVNPRHLRGEKRGWKMPLSSGSLWRFTDRKSEGYPRASYCGGVRPGVECRVPRVPYGGVMPDRL
jgi:hypothetical protein